MVLCWWQIWSEHSVNHSCSVQSVRFFARWNFTPYSFCQLLTQNYLSNAEKKKKKTTTTNNNQTGAAQVGWLTSVVLKVFEKMCYYVEIHAIISRMQRKQRRKNKYLHVSEIVVELEFNDDVLKIPTLADSDHEDKKHKADGVPQQPSLILYATMYLCLRSLACNNNNNCNSSSSSSSNNRSSNSSSSLAGPILYAMMYLPVPWPWCPHGIGCHQKTPFLHLSAICFGLSNIQSNHFAICSGLTTICKASKALLTQTGMHNSGAPSYASDA